MDTVKGYLENSSICGFSHITTSKTKIERVFWLLVAFIAVAAAGYLVWEAFDDWAQFPISTITETYPINQAQFPKIVVCPPKVAFTFTQTNLSVTRISGPYGPLKILAPAKSLLASLTSFFSSPSTSSLQPSPPKEKLSTNFVLVGCFLLY